jgi:hypothetical protein
MVGRKEDLSSRLSAGSPAHHGRDLLRDPEACEALVAAFRWLHLLPMVEFAVHAADIRDGFVELQPRTYDRECGRGPKSGEADGRAQVDTDQKGLTATSSSLSVL